MLKYEIERDELQDAANNSRHDPLNNRDALFNFMSFFAKHCLGVDVGASSIKIVEISMFGKRKKLENYAEFNLPQKDGFTKNTFESENMLLLSEEVARVLKALLKAAKIKERNAAFSIPDFSTFFTAFSLPPMSKSEVDKAVEFEARHHIPLSLSEVTFDWQVIDRKEILPGIKLKILLVAVPNKVLNNYQKMANISALNLKGMEAEIFGLIRAVMPKDGFKAPVCLIDIGWQSTTVGIVDGKTLRASYSFDISGNNFTKSLSDKLKISMQEAEALKRENGLDPKNKEASDILAEEADNLVSEVKKVADDYEKEENKKIESIILSGGTASLFGLRDYFEGRIKKPTGFINPFSFISTPKELRGRLEKIGQSFAVAIGVALMGLES